MVKVLFLQLFLKQHITECELEPIDTYVIDEHAFLVATREGLEFLILIFSFLILNIHFLKKRFNTSLFCWRRMCPFTSIFSCWSINFENLLCSSIRLVH